MRDRIRRLSWKVELVIVLVIAFGWTLPGTLRSLATAAEAVRGPKPPISDISVWGTILFELILFSLLIPFLRMRGWTLARLGIQPSLRGYLQGGALALASYGLYVGFAVLVASAWPEVARALASTRLVGQALSWSTVAVASIINPFFEEIFVCGYVISVLTERRTEVVAAPVPVIAEGESGEPAQFRGVSPVPVQGVSRSTAVNISAVVRLSYHLYQGAAGVLAVVPLGLLFGFWFART